MPIPSKLRIERAAIGLKRQLVGRIKQFQKIPEARQEKLRQQLNKEHQRVAGKFKQYGFAIPSLEELLEDPQAWLQADLGPAKPKGGAATASVEDVVQDAYLRTLSRYPDQDEMQTALSFINESEKPADGIQSLLWTLVNTKEFIITH